jgi:dihydrofolate reductase
VTRTAYYTAVTLDGFIATPDHSLEWLLSRDIDPQGPMSYDAFSERVGACVMGANTWQWVQDHDPDGWTPKPTWVMTHRDFPPSEQVRFTDADVATVHAECSRPRTARTCGSSGEAGSLLAGRRPACWTRCGCSTRR